MTKAEGEAPEGLEVVLSAVPVGVAPYLARRLVEDRLAACVQVLPGIQSTYRWNGKIEEAQEALLVIKTSPQRRPELMQVLAENHPYAVPEILALPSSAVHGPYLAWALGELSPAPPSAEA